MVMAVFEAHPEHAIVRAATKVGITDKFGVMLLYL
jgi:hypothetical protein